MACDRLGILSARLFVVCCVCWFMSGIPMHTRMHAHARAYKPTAYKPTCYCGSSVYCQCCAPPRRFAATPPCRQHYWLHTLFGPLLKCAHRVPLGLKWTARDGTICKSEKRGSNAGNSTNSYLAGGLWMKQVPHFFVVYFKEPHLESYNFILVPCLHLWKIWEITLGIMPSSSSSTSSQLPLPIVCVFPEPV